MDVLAFIWLAATIYELTEGLSPLLEKIVTSIWIIFAVHFISEFLLAPAKRMYLKHNWLTGISLLLPALRIFRFLRFFRYLRTIRSISLVRIISSINRGMRALSKTLTTRVFIYVLSLTLMVVFSGAAGILNFEKEHSDYVHSFGSALWWSAMMVTTMGSDYFPVTSEGRVLAFVLAVYGFAVFGYVAATFASFILSRVKNEEKKSSVEEEIDSLRTEIRELRAVIEKSIT